MSFSFSLSGRRQIEQVYSRGASPCRPQQPCISDGIDLEVRKSVNKNIRVKEERKKERKKQKVVSHRS